MARHLARRGGIWWARLVVPERFRQTIGRREFVQSCRTADLSMAKAVAAMLIAEWRQSLMRVELEGMDSQVLKLLKPAPVLAIGATITLAEAEMLGVNCRQLLQLAAAKRLKLLCRLSNISGYLLNPDDLQDDPLTGGKDIPRARFMPSTVVESVQNDILAIPDAPQVANAILADGGERSVEIVALAVKSGQWFVPSTTLIVAVGALEVEAKAVAAIRGHLVKRLPKEEIERELAVRQAVGAATVGQANFGLRADRLFSAAVDAYCADPDGLPSRLASAIEIRQRKNSMLLFAEFMGDMPLGQITSDVLRQYREGPLRQIPAKANTLPKALKQDSMIATINAIKNAGIDWPLLSLEMRQERMSHLGRLFAWLYAKEWINFNPAASLAGEHGISKAERIKHKRQQRTSKGTGDDEDGRQPFTTEELKRIFERPQYSTGDGRHVLVRNAAWYPFEYWLPLLGLYAGCRISEVSQLHLSDVRQVSGVWVLDLNENTPDKKLKTEATSFRHIPLHPKLVELGFLKYCETLGQAGFLRVFPELTYSTSDARYAKEPIRKMSAMLKALGMQRNTGKVFHCLRHNLNDALARVPMAALPYADQNLRKFIRHKIMGHKQADDVNAQHYTSSTIDEAASLVAGVAYELPRIEPFKIEAGLQAVRTALTKKKSHRRGREDMGLAGGH
jgi:integrase